MTRRPDGSLGHEILTVGRVARAVLSAPRIRHLLLRLLLATIVGLALLGADVAHAHNSFDSSEPADGSVTTTSPPSITMVFTKDVPLDTLTVTLIEPSGVRTDLLGSAHGAAENIVVTPLPPDLSGSQSVRWKLVSPDGHVVSGRVEFTVTADLGSTTTLAGVTPPSTVDVAGPSGSSAFAATPDSVRWVTRSLAYVGLLLLVGALGTERFVWRDAVRNRAVRTTITVSVAVIVVTALVQLATLASDLSERSLWGALSSLDPAADVPGGWALVVRVSLAIGMWLLVVRGRPATLETYRDATLLMSIGLLATWSFAGHARTMRWAVLGVPLDIVHHGAAAVWLGVLVIVGSVGLRTVAHDDVVAVMQRTSRTAATAVLALVATGAVQGIRLVGSPTGLFDTRHGRLLIAKLVLVALMLLLADRNRRMVRDRFRGHAISTADVTRARRMIVREMVVGSAVIGLTASLVVATPAAS